MEKNIKRNWWKVSTAATIVLLMCLLSANHLAYLNEMNRKDNELWELRDALFKANLLYEEEGQTIAGILAKIVMEIRELTSANITIQKDFWEYRRPERIIASVQYPESISAAIEKMVNEITREFGLEIFNKPVHYYVHGAILTVGIIDRNHSEPWIKSQPDQFPIYYLVGIKINATTPNQYWEIYSSNED